MLILDVFYQNNFYKKRDKKLGAFDSVQQLLVARN
jgi:hypothetical protein